MRAYRFVNELGIAAGAAGEAVASAADVTASHQGGLSGEQRVNARVGAELLRQLTRETDGKELERAVFAGQSVRNEEAVQPTYGFDVGIAVSIELPTYKATTVAYGTVVHDSTVAGAASSDSDVRELITSLLEQTRTGYLLLVTEGGVRVIPGHSLLALVDPPADTTFEDHLYGRSIRRFLEALAEGFVGVTTSDGSTGRSVPADNTEAELLTWTREHELNGAFGLRVTTTEDQPESSLSAFLD